VSAPRGQKNYTLTKVLIVIATIFAVIAMYSFRHASVGKPLKEILAIDLSVDAFGTIASATVAYDLYYLAALVYTLSIVDVISLRHPTLLIWILIYTVLSVLFGACVFNTIFFAHIEYLRQKYKYLQSSSIMDHLLFVAINGVVLAITVYIGMFLPANLVLFK